MTMREEMLISQKDHFLCYFRELIIPASWESWFFSSHSEEQCFYLWSSLSWFSEAGKLKQMKIKKRKDRVWKTVMVIQTCSMTIPGKASALLHWAGIQPLTSISCVQPQGLCPHLFQDAMSTAVVLWLFSSSCDACEMHLLSP